MHCKARHSLRDLFSPNQCNGIEIWQEPLKVTSHFEKITIIGCLNAGNSLKASIT